MKRNTRSVERARELLAEGKTRPALTLLKDLALTDAAARRELAETYRRMGNPDQAGRWGILVPGWTSEREQDRLARLLAAAGVRRDDLAAFLDVPTEAALSPEAVELYEDRVPEYRERFRARSLDRSWRASPGSRVEDVADVGVGIVALVGVVLIFIVFVGSMLDLDGRPSFARASAAMLLGAGGVLFLVRVVGNFLRRRARAAVISVVLGASLLAGAVMIAPTVEL